MDIFELKLLLVDDEPGLLKMVSGILADAGFKNIDTAKNALSANDKIMRQAYHLVILDVMLPDMDGFSLFEKWQKNGIETPVIFLSAKDEDVSRLKGLGLGADDYITKPFLPEELILRVRAVLKRTYRLSYKYEDIMIGSARINFEEGIVYRDGTEIPLTAKELELLKKLCENRGRIVQTGALLDTLWPDGSFGYENSLMVHIRRLREKIEDEPSDPKYIQTVRGLGYRLKKQDISKNF